jgi:hypothetical protein
MTMTNTNNRESIILGDTPLKEVDAFTYPGSVIVREGGTEKDVKTSIQKTREAFIKL